VRLRKNGQARRVPLNTTARAAHTDLGTRRLHPTEPDELVSRGAYRTVSHLRAVQELGGWRTLSMVQRYAHLSPRQLAAAVRRSKFEPFAAVHYGRRYGRASSRQRGSWT
jgi:site-specific recombinase XerC